MISYYLLEDDVPPQPPKPVVVQKVKSLFEGETTECNYLVFAFIIGVLFLGIADFAKR